MTDLTYHRWLDPVALADAAFLRRKDAQYGGSWKKRGGVGAFMMLARKWDRLENTISQRGAFGGGEKDAQSWDILAWIDREVRLRRHHDPLRRSDYEACAPDGDVLAEVRDLRRYLLIIEAYLVETGAVPPPPMHDVDSVDGAPDRPEKDRRAPADEPATYTKTVPSETMRRVMEVETAGDGRTLVPAAPAGVGRARARVVTSRSEAPVPPEGRPGTPEDGGQHARAEAVTRRLRNESTEAELDLQITDPEYRDLLPEFQQSYEEDDQGGWRLRATGDLSAAYRERMEEEIAIARNGLAVEDEEPEVVGDRQPMEATQTEYDACRELTVRRGSMQGMQWRHLYAAAPRPDGRWVMERMHWSEYGK